jgi:hypothetical protein
MNDKYTKAECHKDLHNQQVHKIMNLFMWKMRKSFYLETFASKKS